jgi:hypothetical protein
VGSTGLVLGLYGSVLRLMCNFGKYNSRMDTSYRGNGLIIIGRLLMIHHHAYSEILKEHPYLEQSVGKSTDVDSRKKSESTHDERSKKRFVL